MSYTPAEAALVVKAYLKKYPEQGQIRGQIVGSVESYRNREWDKKRRAKRAALARGADGKFQRECAENQGSTHAKRA